MVSTTRTHSLPRHGERGFTLVEFMIASAITVAVLGATVGLATQLQQGYSTQLDDATVEQEARFTLDWIARIMRSAGSNPYTITLSPCSGTPAFQALDLDPNLNGIQDDVRVQADINPPDGLIIGVAGACTTNPELGEDVTIAHDPATLVITRRDHAVDAAGVTMTEPIFTELLFTYLDTARAATTTAATVAYAQIRITGRSRAFNPITQEFPTSSLETEVRLRVR